MVGLGFKLIHKQIGHNWTDWGSSGHPMHLFIMLTLEGEIDVFKAELQECCDVLY